MIDSLRRRLIGISGLSVILVFILIYIGICVISISRLNQSMDLLTDVISPKDGRFPEFNEMNPPPDRGAFPFITRETPFSTRFFTVRLDASTGLAQADTAFIASVSEEAAEAYADRALDSGQSRGWIEDYRYKISDTNRGQTIVFVDGTMNRSLTRMLLVTVGLVLLCALALILLLIILFSKRSVKPIAESYEKQKQFITDANHELKTPLTLILTNLDILEADMGQNEWLEDIRAEGKRMHALINQLGQLTRMDEAGGRFNPQPFSLTKAILDTASDFQSLSEEKGLPILLDLPESVTYKGNEAELRRLMAILLDNALKYCDPEGQITLRLTPKRHPLICVENTYKGVDQIELDKLFDRFYRADKARTYTGGFGIGLSIAKAITERHGGQIQAYKAGDGRIGFRLTLK